MLASFTRSRGLRWGRQGTHTGIQAPRHTGTQAHRHTGTPGIQARRALQTQLPAATAAARWRARSPLLEPLGSQASSRSAGP